MKCDLVQLSLPAYRDKNISSEQARLIEEHLADCPVCFDYYNQEEELSYSFREAAAGLEPRLHFQFQTGSPARRLKPVWLSPMAQIKWAAAMAAFGILVFGALYFYKSSSSQQVPAGQVAGSRPRSAVHEAHITPGVQQEGIVQIITIEDGSGHLAETFYLQEEDGLTSEISVKVTAIRLANTNG